MANSGEAASMRRADLSHRVLPPAARAVVATANPLREHVQNHVCSPRALIFVMDSSRVVPLMRGPVVRRERHPIRLAIPERHGPSLITQRACACATPCTECERGARCRRAQHLQRMTRNGQLAAARACARAARLYRSRPCNPSSLLVVKRLLQRAAPLRPSRSPRPLRSKLKKNM